MSELPHTTGQIDPTQYADPAEITPEQIDNASAEDILTVANNEYNRLDELQFRDDVVANASMYKGVQQQLKHMERVLGAAEGYAQQGRGESFGDFLDTRINRATKAGNSKVQEAYRGVENWFNTSSTYDAIGNVLRSKQEQSTAQPEVHPTRDPQAEATRQKQAVEAARHSVEQAHSVELFDDIVKLGKNRTQLNTDVVSGFEDIGDASRNEARLTGSGVFEQRFKRDNKVTDWRQELNEVATFSDVIEQDKHVVVHQRQEKGRFGRTHTAEYTRTEPVPGSEHPKMTHNELTGQDEPTVRFRYNFNLRSSHAAKAEADGELPSYLEFGGHRRGNAISVGMELPKSVADSLQKQILQDPQSVRTLVEKLFLENSNGQMTEAHWRQGDERVQHPARPPYEKLPSDWNMAIVANQEGEGVTDGYKIERVQTQQ